MNFYKHYIGDFQRDTSHLSLTERGAYLSLIHHYYATELPLPKDHAALCRIAGAFTKPERDAVKTVMTFFTLVDSGLMHNRIEAELHRVEAINARIRALRDGGTYRQYRELVLTRDGAQCAYCKAVDVPLQLDHVVAKSRGGTDAPENLVPACKPCNTSKGAKSLNEWMTAK